MTGDGMKRSVGLGLLMAVVCPLALAAQGVPAAPAALPVDSLVKAANAAAAANTVAINFVWALMAGVLVMFIQAGGAMVDDRASRPPKAGRPSAPYVPWYRLL